MPRASYPLRFIGGLAVVSAPREICAGDADLLRVGLLAACCGAAVIVVDMSGTRRCEPAGLHVLQRAYQRARSGHGELRLVLPRESVLRELANAGLDPGIPCYASLGDALAVS